MASPVPFEEWRKYVEPLRDQGIEPVLMASPADLEPVSGADPSVVVLVLGESMSRGRVAECQRACADRKLPSMVLVPRDGAGWVEELLQVDDFILSPPMPEELVLRARRLIRRRAAPGDEDMVSAGDLVINKANFEVTIGGRRVSLRYKEYELLLLMASNPGRVFPRETLLNRIWGYDYLGGTRTVDVHIRRLRSKIEDAEHTFIETVWQVGYRFRSPDSQDPPAL